MITRRTKIQLLVFVLITLVGVTFTGARYARLDRLIMDTSYTVVAHFPDSGGIFAGGEVTYRGVGIGKVSRMQLVEDGVDVYLQIDDEWQEIPADSRALVGNRSAVGEQYVELQPSSDGEPFLEDGSEIAQDETAIPISTTTLLTNLDKTVRSVDQGALRTTINELGDAFDQTGDDLQSIIDSGNSFITAADDNFDVTRSLIRNSNVVLRGQVASESSIRSFARDLSLFTDALAGADDDLRTVIDNGSAAANQLRTFLKANEVDLAQLLGQLRTTGQIVVKRLDGVRQLLIIYPYVVEAGFTVVDKDPDTGLNDAHFGLVLTEQPLCEKGYESTDKRPPQELKDIQMNFQAHCAAAQSRTSARGAQHAPRAGADYSAPVASFDSATGTVTWGPQAAADGSGDAAGSGSAPTGTVAPALSGEESWKWLFLQPVTARQR